MKNSHIYRHPVGIFYGAQLPWRTSKMLKSYVNSHMNMLSTISRTVFGHDVGEIEIKVSPLDSRLRLALCDDFLTFTMKQSPGNHANASIHIECQAYNQWAIYIPIRVNRFSEVVTTKTNVAKGTLLDASHLTLQRVNLSTVRGHYLENR